MAARQDRRTITEVALCGLGPASQPLSEQPEGVEVNTGDGDFWLHHCLGTWHVYRAQEGLHLDTAEWLSRWGTWADALQAIIERREVAS